MVSSACIGSLVYFDRDRGAESLLAATLGREHVYRSTRAWIDLCRLRETQSRKLEASEGLLLASLDT
jgi:hypothetical protein